MTLNTIEAMGQNDDDETIHRLENAKNLDCETMFCTVLRVRRGNRDNYL